MPEVLRDLVVSLSLKTDNFSRNINSIQEIARNVGYEDSLTFSKAFKRFFGVSPKYFRTTSADDRPEMDAIIAARRENVKQE